MRLLTLSAGILLSVAATGQLHTLSLNYKPGASFFGQESQSFRNQYFGSRKGDMTFVNAISILYGYRLSSKVNLSVGFDYSEQGQDINFNADSAWPSFNRVVMNVDLKYARVPLTVSYYFLNAGNYTFGAYTGVSMGVAIKRKDNYQQVIPEYILLPTADKRYKKLDWAVPLGLNCKKTIASNLYANLGVEYLVGLTNAFSTTYKPFGVLNEFNNSRQNRLALNVGLSLALGK